MVKSLLDYRQNTYSQNGEDGVLEELLKRLGLWRADLWCVEFGAWDGKHLSNTFRLVKDHCWNAVYIEGDAGKYPDLLQTASEFPTVRPICAMVGGPVGSGTALDDLLESSEVPMEYALLSIDIDTSDLDVWARHVARRPLIVTIEIDSSAPPGILQWHSELRPGNSFSATVEVAAAKGYQLVCHTGNLIFVDKDVIELVGLDPLDICYPERLFQWDWVVRAESSLPDKIKRRWASSKVGKPKSTSRLQSEAGRSAPSP